MKTMVRLLGLLGCMMPLGIHAQTLPDFLEAAVMESPAWKRASIDLRKAEAKLLEAQAAFDPTWRVSDRGKSVGSDLYYRYQDAQWRIPALGGVDLYVGGQWGNGDWMNPESSLPASGLVAAGISVPIGPTLWFSERQQNVTRARWHYRMAKQHWDLTRWDIQREALNLYLTWSLKVAAQEAYASSWTYLDAQLDMYRQAFRMGGVSQRDTLDLFAARNTRKSQALQSGWEAQSAFEKMSSFLGHPIDSMRAWTPMELDADTWLGLPAPVTRSVEAFPQMALAAMWAEASQRDAQFESMQRWNVPSLGYQFLQKTEDLNPYGGAWKVTWDLPLWNRANRAERALSRLQLQYAAIQQDAMKTSLSNEVQQRIQMWGSMKENVVTVTDQTATYASLLSLERSSLQLGYSSVFQVNQREVAYLDALLKRNQSMAEYITFVGGWWWLTGQEVPWPAAR